MAKCGGCETCNQVNPDLMKLIQNGGSLYGACYQTGYRPDIALDEIRDALKKSDAPVCYSCLFALVKRLEKNFSHQEGPKQIARARGKRISSGKIGNS